MSSSDSLPSSFSQTTTTSDMKCYPSPRDNVNHPNVNLDDLPKVNPNTGLVFPEGRIWQQMTENMDDQITIEPDAAVYMTGVLEYLTYALIEQSVVEAGAFEPEMNDNRNLIHPRHVMNAIKNNRQLKRLCHELCLSPSSPKLQSNDTQSSEFLPFQPQILINACQISTNDEKQPSAAIFDENRLNVKRKIDSSYAFDESLSSSADIFNKKAMQSMNSFGYDSDDEEIQHLILEDEETIEHNHTLTSHGWLLSNERIHLPMNEPIFDLFANNIKYSFINGLLYIPSYLRMDELYAITNEINEHEWKEFSMDTNVFLQNMPLVNIYQLPNTGTVKETYFQKYCNFSQDMEISEFLVKLVKKIVIEFDLKWSKNHI